MVEPREEALAKARELWAGCLVLCSGPGTFTPEQTDEYCTALIAAALQELMDQRNAYFLEVGKIWIRLVGLSKALRAVQDTTCGQVLRLRELVERYGVKPAVPEPPGTGS